MSSQQVDYLKLLIEAIGLVLSVGVGLLFRMLFYMRRMDRRTLLLSLEHEDLISDLKERKPQYQRPAEKMAKLRKLNLG